MVARCAACWRPLAAERMERRANAWTTRFAAGWAMTVGDPQTLWDLGFQLSALASASLLAYGTGVEALLLRTPLSAGWLDWAREALAGGMVWLPLGQWLALPAYLCLAWLTEGARVFARLPYAAVAAAGVLCDRGGWLWSVAVGAAAPGSGATEMA